eukprot:symbB.v1.2.008134.t1/scaffold509.1/size193965/4
MRPDSPKSLNSNEAGAPPTVLKTRSNPSLSKELETFYSWESLKKLAFCFIALNTSMILWGIAQEFIMTNVYVGRHGQILQLPSPLFLVLCNRTTTMIFSSILLRLRGQVLFFSGAIDALPPAVSNTCASWSQYACLGYISFGLQTTAKSIKILPVVIISSLRGRVHSLTDYAECLVLACACFVFGFESEAGSDSMTTLTGLVLLAAYILCDSLTPHFQDILFQKHEEIDAVQATLAMSSIAVVLMLIEMTLTFKLFESVAFIWQCSLAHAGAVVGLYFDTVYDCLHHQAFWASRLHDHLIHSASDFGPGFCRALQPSHIRPGTDRHVHYGGYFDGPCTAAFGQRSQRAGTRGARRLSASSVVEIL